MIVNQLVFYHSALCTFRIRQSREPEYLTSIMCRNNRAERIILPNTSLTLAKKSYCFRGANQWNNLPDDIRKINRIGVFKSQLRKWIQQNVAQFVDS